MQQETRDAGRVIVPEKKREDTPEAGIRPRRLGEYVGQERVREAMDIAIRAAQGRSEPMDHTMLYGPPGLGKTTLARIIATEMSTRLRTTSGPAIMRPGDMVAILTQLGEGDVLFIDEIHRLNRVVEEVLYPAMEDGFVSWVIDKGLKARSMNLRIKPFTLVGATTRYGLVSEPLRSRFGAVHRLDYYDPSEMRVLLERASAVLDMKTSDTAIGILASRSRGTPRIGIRLLRRVRDYAQVMASGLITADIASEALDLMGVDARGLDRMDRAVLDTIMTGFGGGPVGLKTLSMAIGEDAGSIEEVCEPFLLQLGLIERTPRGRSATPRAYVHMGTSRDAGSSSLDRQSGASRICLEDTPFRRE